MGLGRRDPRNSPKKDEGKLGARLLPSNSRQVPTRCGLGDLKFEGRLTEPDLE